MGVLRGLQRRVVTLERAAMPQPSPLVLMYGSFDIFVEIEVLPAIETGHLSREDMIDVVAALRLWEEDGTWDRAHKR
jgi:hypothetical protein